MLVKKLLFLYLIISIVGVLVAIFAWILIFIGFPNFGALFSKTSDKAVSFEQQNQKQRGYEVAYAAIAGSIDSPELCYKISPHSLSRGAGWSPRGYQIGFVRSLCFYYVALNTENTYFCKEVVPYSTVFADGSKYSPGDCAAKINEGRNPRIGTGFFEPYGVQWLLEELGYKETMIPEYLKSGSGPEIYWTDYYFEIQRTKDFQDRLKTLPDFSTQQ